MKTITIAEAQILSGIASSQESDNGIFDPEYTYGINPFKRLDTYGQIRRGYAPTDITGTVIKDTIVQWAFNQDYYGAGNNGYLYQVAGTLSATVTELNSAGRSARSGLSHYGCFIFHNGTSNLLHYIYGTKIGTYDFSSSFTADVFTGLESAPHPSVEFDGKRFIGNGRYVAKLSGATLTLQALVLPIGYEVQDLKVYNNYMAVLAYKNLGSLNVECKLFIWDTYSSATQWQSEYLVPERALAMNIYKGDLALFGDNFRLFRGGAFDVICQIGTSAVLNHGNTFSGDNIVYWQDDDKLMAYGSPTARIKPCLFSPMGATGKGGAIIRTDAKYNRFLISRNTSALNFFKENSTASSSVAKTVNIDMKRGRIRSAEFIFDKLATGDAVVINMYDDKGNAILTKTLQYSDEGAVTSKRITIHSAPTSYFNIELSYNSRGGDVKFREINIDYEPTRIPA
jgi:hypothetical protein